MKVASGSCVARYYDPRTSVWQSVDPILGKYLPTGDKEKDKNLAGIGGVFNSRNLGMYSYVGLNPIILTDPNGKELVKIDLNTAAAKKYISLDDNPRAQRGIVVDRKYAPGVKKFLNKLIKNKTYVRLNTSFRTTAEQNVLRKNNKLASKKVSAHEAGLALDISVKKKANGDWLNPASVDGVKTAAQDSKMRWGPNFKDAPHVDAAKRSASIFGYKNRQDAADTNQADFKTNKDKLPTVNLVD